MSTEDTSAQTVHTANYIVEKLTYFMPFHSQEFPFSSLRFLTAMITNNSSRKHLEIFLHVGNLTGSRVMGCSPNTSKMLR